MKAFLSRIDPLVWFACLGGAIFAINALRTETPREVIEITPEMAEVIVANREALVGTSLPLAMAEGLVSRYVDEEILVREAVAEGLHLGDSKIRARLIARMDFLLSTEAPAPTAGDLAKLRADNPERYLTVRRYTFDHRFFGANKTAAAAALAAYQANRAMVETGTEPFWLGERMEAYASVQLLSVLGHKFARVLPDLPLDVWSGPVESSRGWHLVRLTEVVEPGPLRDDELQFRLSDDWRRKHRMKAREAALTELRQAYEIRLPEPPSAGMGAAAAEPAQ